MGLLQDILKQGVKVLVEGEDIFAVSGDGREDVGAA